MPPSGSCSWRRLIVVAAAALISGAIFFGPSSSPRLPSSGVAPLAAVVSSADGTDEESARRRKSALALAASAVAEAEAETSRLAALHSAVVQDKTVIDGIAHEAQVARPVTLETPHATSEDEDREIIEKALNLTASHNQLRGGGAKETSSAVYVTRSGSHGAK